MKHILFNYFLTSDELFREKRMLKQEGDWVQQAERRSVAQMWVDIKKDQQKLDDARAAFEKDQANLPAMMEFLRIENEAQRTGLAAIVNAEDAASLKLRAGQIMAKGSNTEYSKQKDLYENYTMKPIKAMMPFIDVMSGTPDALKYFIQSDYNPTVEDLSLSEKECKLEVKKLEKEMDGFEDRSDRNVPENLATVAKLKAKRDTYSLSPEERKKVVDTIGDNKEDLDPDAPKFAEKLLKQASEAEEEAKRLGIAAKQLAEDLKRFQLKLEPLRRIPSNEANQKLKELRKRVGEIGAPRLAAIQDGFAPGKEVGPKDLGKLDFYQKCETLNINADDLQFASPEALAYTIESYKALGLEADVVDFMGSRLEYAFSAELLAKDPTVIALYQNPNYKVGATELNKIQNDNPGFYAAYIYFATVRDMIKDTRKHKEGMIEGQRKSQEEPITTFVGDKLGEAGSKFMDALNQRDYGTLALYGALAYGLYKLYENNKGKHGDAAKWLAYGAAAYAGACIFAPEKVKEFWGKGVNADLAGTKLDTLQKMANNNKEAYERGLDAGIGLAINNADVRNIFRPITQNKPGVVGMDSYDAKSAPYGMIQLANPGIERCFRNSAFANVGPVYLDGSKPYESLSSKEKMYVDACKRLYNTAVTLKEMYRNTVEKRTHVSFENAFLNENPGNTSFRSGVTMEALYYLLGQYNEGSDKGNVFDSDVLKKTKEDLMTKFAPAGLDKIRMGQGNIIYATAYGFPIIIQRAAGGGKIPDKYHFALVNEPSVTFDFEAKENSDPTFVMQSLEGAIRTRMSDLLVNAKFEKAPGVPSEMEYDPAHKLWVAKVTVSGYEAIGMAAYESTIELIPDDKATSVNAHVAGTDGPGILIDGSIDVGTSFVLINIFKNQENAGVLWPLRYLNNSGMVKLDFERGSKVPKFILDVAGHKIEMEYKLKGKVGSYVLVDDLDNKNRFNEIFSDPRFIDKYVEARIKQKDFKIFDDMKDYLKTMPQSYVGHFFGSMYDALTELDWQKALDAASGGIPDNQMGMLIDSRRDMVLNRLQHDMSQAKNPDDVLTAERNLEMDLKGINAYYNAILSKAKSSNGSWSRDDFIVKIMEPLRDVGMRSNSYARATEYFEQVVIKGLNITDFKKDAPLAGHKLMNVYFYYTAHLDSISLDKMAANGTIPRDTASKENYFHYVADLIGNTYSTKMQSPDNIPTPPWMDGGTPVIETYEQWQNSSETFAPVDLSDTLPAYTDPAEIETELLTGLNRVVDSYKSMYPISHANINLYLYDEFFTKQGLGKDALMIFQSTNGRRSQQMNEIARYVALFADSCAQIDEDTRNKSLRGLDFWMRWWKKSEYWVNHL